MDENENQLNECAFKRSLEGKQEIVFVEKPKDASSTDTNKDGI